MINYIIYLEDYENFDLESAKEMCSASLMLNIYKNNIPFDYLLNFYYDLDKKKNRYGNNFKEKYLENNKSLENEFIYIYKISGYYNLNMNITIPDFKPIELIYLFFTFENSNKYYFGPIFDNIEIDNNMNLYETQIVLKILQKKFL